MIRHWNGTHFLECSWFERIQLIFMWIIMWGVVLPVMFIGVIYLLGSMGESYSQYREDYDRCMKHATNGYEIERCK
jgi:hypothetical protein